MGLTSRREWRFDGERYEDPLHFSQLHVNVEFRGILAAYSSGSSATHMSGTHRPVLGHVKVIPSPNIKSPTPP